LRLRPFSSSLPAFSAFSLLGFSPFRSSAFSFQPSLHVRSISTRTGDDGTTGLLYGRRLPKDHPQIEAMGSLDEFNAALGLAKATSTDAGRKARSSGSSTTWSAHGEIACAEADEPRHAVARFAKVVEATSRGSTQRSLQSRRRSEV